MDKADNLLKFAFIDVSCSARQARISCFDSIGSDFSEDVRPSINCFQSRDVPTGPDSDYRLAAWWFGKMLGELKDF